jgi:3-hydroxy-9,10-secoandrosta-1,3,5(10)-triene-9,17-dione monooxygenase reductase component
MEERHDPVPEGMSADARETWPSTELIESWLGPMYDFQLRPGEDIEIAADDPEAMAAARRFRDVLGRFASGVTVVTTMSGDEPVGMTCQSFCSVSLDPPLVLFSPAKTSRAWPRIRQAGRFCINLLAADQAGLSNQMASRGSDKFAGVGWRPSPRTGSPVLDGTLGYVDCTVHAVYEAGDHYVVIGAVQELHSSDVPDPLLFYEGRYLDNDTCR